MSSLISPPGLARRALLHCALLAATGTAAAGDPLPEDRGAAGLWRALLELSTTASAMHLTAHPDDEDAGLLCLLARGKGVRTSLLTLTRGEGGANLISQHFFDELSLLRTLELLRADAFYGVEQFFTRAADYGYSKTVEEALKTWGGEEGILRDAVRAIRRERPDVIFARFRGDARDGHGHHSLSGIIARKAFDAAADPSRFPEQIAEGLRPWQAKKLYHGNVNPQRRPEDMDLVTVTLDPGVYDPLLGRSYAQIGREGYSYHRSQGMMGPPSPPGPSPSRYHLLKSTVQRELPKEEKSFFDAIDTTIVGLAKLAGDGPRRGRIAEHLRKIQHATELAQEVFNSPDTEKTVPFLLEGLRVFPLLVPEVEMIPEPGRWELRSHLQRKMSEFRRALQLAAAIEVDVRVKRGGRGEPSGGDGRPFSHAIPGQDFTAQVTVTSRSMVPLEVFGVTLEGPAGLSVQGDFKPRRAPNPNDSITTLLNVHVPEEAPPTRPHWRRDSIEESLYRINDAKQANDPLPEAPFKATVRFAIGDVPFTVTEPLRVPVEEPKRGVRMEPLVIAPAISLRFPSSHGVLPAGQREYRLPLLVRSSVHGPATAMVRLKLPDGWTSEPPFREMSFEKEEDEGRIEFTVRLGAAPPEGPAVIEAIAAYKGQEYSEGFITVSAPDVGRFDSYHPARHAVRVVDVKCPRDLRLAYVMGSGDEVPAALELLGLRAEMLGAAELASGDLSGYDAVVIGVRAYAVRPDLAASNRRLLDYARDGGVVLVQYQTPEFDRNFGPYPYSMTGSPEEVSEEDAPVTLLEPGHPVFTSPNAITTKDFDGWVEERGSKLLKTWDERYQPLLECHDQNQEPQKGGLLFARHGKGAYVYCAYAFYRQLPHGVPGAFRLFANLISLRRNLAEGEK